MNSAMLSKACVLWGELGQSYGVFLLSVWTFFRNTGQKTLLQCSFNSFNKEYFFYQRSKVEQLAWTVFPSLTADLQNYHFDLYLIQR